MRDKSIIAGLALYLVVAGSGCGEGVSSESGEVPLPGLGLRVAVEPIAPIAVAESEGADHLLYELQKYIVIEKGRRNNPAKAQGYKQHVFDIIRHRLAPGSG